MAAHLPTNELVKEMLGKDTLDEWDVLVSYNENQVNQLLSAQVNSMGELANLNFIEPLINDRYNPPVKEYIKWSLELSNPQLQIVGSSGEILLKFDFVGTRTEENGREGTLPRGWKIQLRTQLVNVKGSIATSGFEPEQTTAKDTANDETAERTANEEAVEARANVIVRLSTVENAAQAICLDLADKNIILNIIHSTDQSTPRTTLLKDFEIAISTHIHVVAGLKFYIGGLTNKYLSDGRSRILTPETFCFTCVAGNQDSGTPGTLCMWIGLEGSEGGKAPGQTSAIFFPAQKERHPIPKDSTASVIFSHRLIGQYITSVLKDKGVFDDLKVTTLVGKVGLVITGRCNAEAFQSYQKYSGKRNTADNWGKIDERYSDISFKLDDEDTIFRFGSEDSLRDITVSYLSGKKHLKWSKQISRVGILGNPSSGALDRQEKTLTAKFGFKGSAEWKDKYTKETPNMLQLQFTIPKEFTVMDASTSARSFWWGTFPAEAPHYYKKIDVDLPDLNLQLDGLDYFLTTNLLMPGSHVFVADKPDDEKGDNHGLFMPRDMLLTGKVFDGK